MRGGVGFARRFHRAPCAEAMLLTLRCHSCRILPLGKWTPTSDSSEEERRFGEEGGEGSGGELVVTGGGGVCGGGGW